ncbi:MAG: tyrosine-protein phosphatase [Bifidobacterium sp.]|jgi:protein tyrosine/serine phosphatase|nr:tyrosine-protein phosphatase [Bifidobacterium sp.]
MDSIAVEGLANVRDLGGMKRSDGTATPGGVFIRSEKLDDVTETGWQQLRDLGVRTVIDLRHPEERAGGIPMGFSHVLIDLDGDDRTFWDIYETDDRCCTPLYYAPHLGAHPELMGAVLKTIAQARSGAVLFHCASGWDRTGFVSAVLLKAIGVTTEAAVDDYMRSYFNDEAMMLLHNRRSDVEERLAVLRRYGHTPRSAFAQAYESIDIGRFLDAAKASTATGKALGTWRGALEA